jgi:hypothetical protein
MITPEEGFSQLWRSGDLDNYVVLMPGIEYAAQRTTLKWLFSRVGHFLGTEASEDRQGNALTTPLAL